MLTAADPWGRVASPDDADLIADVAREAVGLRGGVLWHLLRRYFDGSLTLERFADEVRKHAAGRETL